MAATEDRPTEAMAGMAPHRPSGARGSSIASAFGPMGEERAQSPVASGDVVGGKYRVERMLGAGGMGVVVAARHEQLGQLVALKFILPEIAARPDLTERFLREGRAVVQLQSQHVARVSDVGVETIGGKPAPYLVMEYLEGADLHTLLRRGTITVADAVSYVIQACDALAEAHALGIVHRDLKPENLFLARRSGRAPIIKVLDFGIARAAERDDAEGVRRMTSESTMMGTPAYMAPEQMASARDAEARSDIWSLGAVLYELVTGRLPFSGNSLVEICAAILSAAPPPISANTPDVDPALEAVIMKCLDKSPTRRFNSAIELARALAPFGRKEPLADSWGSDPYAAVGEVLAVRVAISGDPSALIEGADFGDEETVDAVAVQPTVPQTPTPEEGPVEGRGPTDFTSQRPSERRGADEIPARRNRRLFVVALTCTAAAVVVGIRVTTRTPEQVASLAITIPSAPASTAMVATAQPSGPAASAVPSPTASSLATKPANATPSAAPKLRTQAVAIPPSVPASAAVSAALDTSAGPISLPPIDDDRERKRK